MKNLTPLMQQYFDLLGANAEYILLFQVGDFYELFDQQARFISSKIGLTLTEKNSFPMCGIPISKLSIYLKKLVQECRLKVAICNQEDMIPGSKLVNRVITKIVTPGTYLDELSASNNFVIALNDDNLNINLVYADINTGECFAEIIDHKNLLLTLERIKPTEILISKYDSKIANTLVKYDDILSLMDSRSDASGLIESYFSTCGYKFDIRNIKTVDNSIYMKLSSSTIENLEIIDGPNSLFNLINRTRTAMGKRLLYKYITRPLRDLSVILGRQECVKYFIDRFNKEGLLKLDIADLSKMINNIKDLNVIYNIGVNIDEALRILSLLRELPGLLAVKQIPHITVHNLILRQISFDSNNEIVVFNDSLRELINRKSMLIEAIHRTVEDYGLNTRVKNVSNQYFIELSGQAPKVPDFFIFSRSLSSATRYTTRDIIRLEQEIVEVDELIENRNKMVFQSLRDAIMCEFTAIEELIDLIANVDFFQSAAICAIEYNYVCPKINNSNYALGIVSGKNPVLSRKNILFVSNDTNLTEGDGIYIITGPNAGGKSTYIRQNALLVYMCQLGLFVSAASMETCIFESMSIRIGTGDNINENKSTFMLEMEECAEILNVTSGRSLVLMDELGRGTSAKEGAAILKAIIRYMEESGFLCIFATHYHDVVHSFKESYAKKMEIYSYNDIIKFTYKVQNGHFTESFAIWVLKMLNLPKRILDLYTEYFICE